MRATRAWLWLTSLMPLLAAASEPDWTKKHEAGRCALRGQCGHNGIFGRDLPCADNGLAEDPSEDVRKQLISICGEEWANTKVCCQADQLKVLESNLKTANNLLSACGACKKNFYDLFCTFTCSPDQSLFVNVTETEPKGEKFLVKEIDQLVSDEFGGGFYKSCKDVSFGSAGAKVMDFFGNSKNYTQLLKFLGDKSILGSPFQINFPRPSEGFPDMKTVLKNPIPCNSTDEIYRCACVDCEGSCPVLSAVKESGACYVGLLPCLSFAVVIVYSVLIALLVLAVTGHVAAAKRQKTKNERLQLLQDITPSDDEDEGHIVHSAGMLDRPTKQYAVNTFLDRVFSKLGRACSNFPAITISSSVLIVGLLSLGWIRFAVETDPVKLWVAPDSDAAKEKEFFDTNFGPFFRTEQAFLVNDTDSALGHSPVLSYDTLVWWFDIERRISVQKSLGSGYTLEDVCYNPTGDACVIQSLSGYFTSENLDLENWEEHVLECSEQTAKEECRPAFKLPIPIERVLGGYNRTEGNQTALQASALVTTWVVSNYNPGDPNLEKAEEWEQSLERLFHDIKDEAHDRGLRLSFSTEISLEQELNKNTNTDAKIVVISYIVMFIYASLALGSTTVTIGTILRNPVGALVQSKFMLGIVGIFIVLMSVAASVGLFAAAGVKATLIIAEVIPFLVLAVGVDNIFLIVHEFERINISHADEDVSERVARTLGRMGPSILLSALTETVAFALGAAVGMPAVRNFAAYAAGAVFINAILQVTMFVSILALNQRRVEDGRLDCIPCLKVQSGHEYHMSNGYGGSPFSGIDEEGFLSKFIRKHYAPAILGKKAKVAIMTVFVGLFAAGIALLPHVELGLDQRIAIPSDSYLIKYFDDLDAYFGSGAPVYFVVKDANVTARPHQQDLCARYTTCHQFSLASILEQERKRPEISFIAEGTASWIDDFFQWLNPEFECCFDGSKKCFEDRDPPWNNTLYGMPEGKEFVDYATRWLDSQPSDDCPMAGKAAYGDAVVIDGKDLTIKASHFRTAHSQLSKQEDFIKAYASARRIAKDISAANDVEVFPYSKFYIFFDQYASIARLAVGLVGAALAFILAISSLLLGSIATGLVVTMTVLMIVVDIVGTMSLVGVSLNAVSLVNIIICVGIGVEFCAHIARAFTIPSPSILERAQSKFRGKDARAWAALVNVGGSVFSGITITKLLGVFVLAFTRSKIFEIYYFRVWLALVLWAALYALVFLPVALSIFGGRGYIESPETDGGLEQDLASRRYRALLPDDEYSDDGY